MTRLLPAFIFLLACSTSKPGNSQETIPDSGIVDSNTLADAPESTENPDAMARQACLEFGYDLNHGDTVCDNAGQATACLDGEIAQGECALGTTCVQVTPTDAECQ